MDNAHAVLARAEKGGVPGIGGADLFFHGIVVEIRLN